MKLFKLRIVAIVGFVKVTDNEFINGGTYADNSIISVQAFAENDTMKGNSKLEMRARVSNCKLGGNIEVGGDVVVYNDTGDCSNGVYYRMTNYYENNLLECDGRSATHIDNLDVNNLYLSFSASQMVLTCNCALLPDCELNAGTQINSKINSEIEVFPNPTNDILNIKTQSTDLKKYELVDLTGRTIVSVKDNLPQYSLNISHLKKGVYFLNILDDKTGSKTVKKIIKQ